MRYGLTLLILIAVPCWSQTTTTGKASTSGSCSPAVTGSKNTFTIKCGIDKEQGQKMLAIMNKILAEHLNTKAVMAKLDELIQSNASSGILLSPSSSGPLKFEIGDSGAVFELEPDKPFWIPFTGEPAALTIERVANHIEVSTTLRDASGKLVAEIERNEWKVRPSLLWDRNYNDNSLEVLGETGEVVLQIVALPDRIRIQGIWWSKSGACTEMASDARHPGGLVLMPRADGAGGRRTLSLYRVHEVFVAGIDHTGDVCLSDDRRGIVATAATTHRAGSTNPSLRSSCLRT